MGIVKLLSRAQIVEEMHQILFNKSDRMLMQMQKRRVVSSNSSVSEEDENETEFVPDNIR